MHHGFDVLAELFENRLNRAEVPDVRFKMGIILQTAFERLAGIARRSLRTKKPRPHIIIDSHNVEIFLVKTLAGFRADEPRRPGYNGYRHRISISAHEIRGNPK